MGVFFGRPSVRGPAGVADAVGAFDRRLLQDLFEIAQFARRAANLQLAFLGDDGDAGGVIAAVFEFAQALDDDGNNFFRSDIADNSAHARRLLESLFKSLARTLLQARMTFVPCAN